MKFFFDNCLSHKFVKALTALSKEGECTIIHLSDKFTPDTKDEEWIKTLAQEEEWVIISADPRIARDRGPRQAWRESNLTAFFFEGKLIECNFWKQAKHIVEWWPKILQEAKNAHKGAGYLINIKSKDFKQIYG